MFPLAANALGGSLLALSGPCFNAMSSLSCDFGYGFRSDAVVASPLRAYCAVPLLNIYGTMYLQFITEDQNVTYPAQSFVSGIILYALTNCCFNSNMLFTILLYYSVP